jgi:hypothetical protein
VVIVKIIGGVWDFQFMSSIPLFYVNLCEHECINVFLSKNLSKLFGGFILEFFQ